MSVTAAEKRLSRAMPDLCPKCNRFPAAFPFEVREVNAGRTFEAAYCCKRCGHVWNCWWDAGAAREAAGLAGTEDGLVVISLPKATLALTPGELRALLSRAPDLWERALRRGKALRRAEAAARR